MDTGQATSVASAPPGAQTLLSLLDERVRLARGPAATHRVDGEWRDVAWAEVAERVRAVSAGLVAFGVKPGERVALFAHTTLQWAVCDLAIAAARAVTVPIYASNTADETRYILQHSQAVLLLVDDDRKDARQPGRLTRARAVVGACKDLRAVVVLDAAAASGSELSLDALVERGASEPKEAYAARVREVGPLDLCHFIYTSGTTGNPKGVMLSHGNWAYQGDCVRRHALMQPDDSVMLFLPLAHSFAQVVKTAWLALGFKLVFAQSVETVVADLAQTRPTIMPSVPRVFEKVFNAVQGAALAKGGAKGALARWAFGHFDAYVQARAAGRPHDTLAFRLAKALVFSKVREQVSARLGGRMRLFVSGGAPLPPKIAWFFDLLGYTVLEGYGLTETSAGCACNRQEAPRIGTVGTPLDGTLVKIAADGEVLIRGPGVMKGYHADPAATAEAIDAEGWFHSGDIGVLDADGYLTITDRKKDLIITSGGKNIAPQNLESLLKACPIISTAMVHGDRRPYLTALICVAEDAARRAAGGDQALDYAALAKDPRVRAEVHKAIDSVNAELPPYSTLKRFTLMDHDFSQESGELTPTLKVKRKHCSQKFAALLDAMYEE